MVNDQSIRLKTGEDALRWMTSNRMIIRSSVKDPETLANIQGFTISDPFRESIGANLLELFTKATSGKKSGLGSVTVRDAFLMAAMAAIMRETKVKLSEDEVETCANILLPLLPITRLEKEGVADQTLRHLAHNKSLVRKLQNVCGL